MSEHSNREIKAAGEAEEEVAGAEVAGKCNGKTTWPLH